MVEANPTTSEQQQKKHNKLTVTLETFNFLPKETQKFQTQDFWSNFFKSKQINENNETSDMEAFEWYADFEDLIPHF